LMKHFKVVHCSVPLLHELNVSVTLNYCINRCKEGSFGFHHDDGMVFEETTTLFEIGLINLDSPFVSVSVFVTFEKLFKAVVRVVFLA